MGHRLDIPVIGILEKESQHPSQRANMMVPSTDWRFNAAEQIVSLSGKHFRRKHSLS